MDNFKEAKDYIISKTYEILDIIKKDDYCETKKVLHYKTRELRELKIYNKDMCDENFLLTLNTNMRRARRLEHMNVGRTYDAYQDSKYLYVITEHCDGGELFD